MPPDTQWAGNPNQKLTVALGNLAYNSATTLYNAAVPYDGVPTANLIPIYTPSNTLWTVPNPL